MPTWVSQLLVQGVGLAVLVALFLVSVVEPHVKEWVWTRFAGSIHAAITRRSREEDRAAIAAIEETARVRSAMATIRTGILTWSTHANVPKTSLVVAQILADIHRGIAELRNDLPEVKPQTDAIIARIADGNHYLPPSEAQMLLEILEAKVRERD